MNVLLVLNDAPYGSERTFNGARLAGALAKQDSNEVRIFLIGDAVSASHERQKVPEDYDDLEVMLGAIARRGGAVGVCGTCMDARGIAADDLIPGAHRSSMDELSAWTVWSDKTPVF